MEEEKEELWNQTRKMFHKTDKHIWQYKTFYIVSTQKMCNAKDIKVRRQIKLLILKILRKRLRKKILSLSKSPNPINNWAKGWRDGPQQWKPAGKWTQKTTTLTSNEEKED